MNSSLSQTHSWALVNVCVAPEDVVHIVYFQYCGDSARSSTGMRREGWGSVEATEMVLNNLFYITAKVSSLHGLSSFFLSLIPSYCNIPC